MDNKANLWAETIDENGKSSIEIHEPKMISQGCRDNEHYFVFDGNAQREALCKNCKTISSFIVGLHKIKEGKITRV